MLFLGPLLKLRWEKKAESQNIISKDVWAREKESQSFVKLRRLGGLSGAGASCRNPERSAPWRGVEGSVFACVFFQLERVSPDRTGGTCCRKDAYD